MYQINSAFNIGKSTARLKTKREYGGAFNDFINELIDKITILNNDNK